MYWKKRNANTFIQRLLIDGILNEDIVTFEIDDKVTKRKLTKTFEKIYQLE